MTYAEKLQDPRWQKLRLQVFDRDNFRCTMCSSPTSTLHVHHKIYLKDKEPWEHPIDLLVTLCKDCHESVTTENKQNGAEILNLIKQSSWFGNVDNVFTSVFSKLLHLNNDFDGAYRFFSIIDELPIESVYFLILEIFGNRNKMGPMDYGKINSIIKELEVKYKHA